MKTCLPFSLIHYSVHAVMKCPVNLYQVLVCCLLFAGSFETVRGQSARNMNVGAIQYNTNEVMSDDELFWPVDRPVEQGRKTMLDVNAIIVGVERTWTDPTGVVRNIQVAQIGRRKFSEIETVTPPVAGAFKRTFRTPYPTKILDDNEWTDQQGKDDPVDPNLPADVVIYTHLNSWTGIDIERWTYGFANDDHDDYIIMEYRFSNQSNEVLNNVYFGLQAQTHANAYYPADIWGNYYGATYSGYVAGNAMADSLRLWYSWDADQTTDATIDTRGKPDPRWGNFQEPQFFGHVVLHADTSPSDERDDPSQPHKAGWSQRELAPDLNVSGHEDIYDYLAKGWDLANPGAYGVTVDHTGAVVSEGAYRILNPELGPTGDASVDINNTTQFDPLTEQEKTSLFSFGPYTLNPGDDIRIVTAYVGGGIPYRWAIDAGAAYSNGNPQQLALEPLPYAIPNYAGDYMDALSASELDAIRSYIGGRTIAQRGATLDKMTKNAVLDLGRPLLFLNAGKAVRTWRSGNVKHGQGSFGIPLAPAAPSLTGFSENDQIRLTWGNEAMEDSRSGSITNYRIYRELIRPSALEVPTDTTFLLHEELPANVRDYVDTRVTRGEDYYYYVAAVNGDGVESSRFLNRTGVTSDKFLEALTPTRSPDENWQNNVVVVPNPYHARGAYNYEEDRRLTFLNLPAYANIHIYTVTGDRVQTIKHLSNTGDADWERQQTFSTTQIVSGIYIYVVEELNSSGDSTGNQAMGKFVVIK